MNVEYVIGRDPQTRQLMFSVNNQIERYGNVNSVPMDVSRRHLSLVLIADDKWIVKNLNENNLTFVNGIAVENKVVSKDDLIELGQTHFPLSWDVINIITKTYVDINFLKNVWTEYEKQTLDIQIAERKFNATRSATGIITMLAIACSILFGHGPVYLILYAFAIGISVVFTIQAYKKARQIPRRQQEIKKHFQSNYVCPKCGRFLGFQDYDVLIQNNACPFCKTKYLSL